MSVEAPEIAPPTVSAPDPLVRKLSRKEFWAEPLTQESLHVFWDEGMLEHDPGAGVFDSFIDPGFLDVLDGHPENATRVRNMVSILKRGPISPYLSWESGRKAKIEELHTFHTIEYVDELIEADLTGGKLLCAGTKLNPGSWDCALLAAGTAIEAMEFVLKNENKIAFALVRPPGHHAQPTMADGYCFLNNAALAAQLALNSGCRRVAMVDIDVHFGNGCAEGFYAREDVMTISLHMDHGSWGPSHKQSLHADQVGKFDGFGFNVNIPLPNGSGDLSYEEAFSEIVIPEIDQYAPNMIIFVIGQDSSQFDPNGRQSLTLRGYRKLGRMVREMADKHCGGKMLVVQEGGYHPTYSAYCLHATLEGVLKLPRPILADPIAYYPEDVTPAKVRIEEVKDIRKRTIGAV